MKRLLFLPLFLFGILGVWLVYWDISDFLTTGLNTGVWNNAILANGLPSICTGAIIIVIVSILGVNVLFK